MIDDRDVGNGSISTRAGTSRDRRRFYAALGVFLVWIAALAVTAVVSGRRPASRPAGLESR